MLAESREQPVDRKNIVRKIIRPLGLFVCFTFSLTIFAAEGMWTLDNLPRSQLKSQYQFDPSADWIAKVMHASVRLAQGCSGSFVSPEGLVLTNHHCAHRCIEQLSSKQRDLAKLGFLATSREKELRCPELELDQLEEMTDVTGQVQPATQEQEGEAFVAAYNKVASQITSACMDGSPEQYIRCDVVSLYHGGKYFLYRYHRYQDVRLVWAPEFSVAFFGGDPDNFNFPRYDLDASLLRAYENGSPAKTADYFRIKSAGASENELVMTTGHPGATQRDLTFDQFVTMRDVRLMRTLILYSELRGVLTQYQKTGKEAARVTTMDLFSVENTLKRVRGQLGAMRSETLLQSKISQEKRLQTFAAQHGELSNANNPWQQIEKAERVYGEISDPFLFLESDHGMMCKYWQYARILVRGASERRKPDSERLPEFTDATLPIVEQTLLSVAPVYPQVENVKFSWALTKLREWLGPDNSIVKKILGDQSPDNLSARMIGATHLGDVAYRRLLWRKPELVAQSEDPFIEMALRIESDVRAIRHRYDTEYDGVIQRAGRTIAEAKFAMTGTDTYPDATFTLRLAYGEVKGWREGDHQVAPFTYIKDAFNRHTGSAPFALPSSWIKAREKMDGDLPFNFVTDNDIVGGNSGSPVINRDAELVGVVFDGNIHSLGGAFGFDESVNRAVALHPAALLNALKVIYKADAIVAELNAK